MAQRFSTIIRHRASAVLPFAAYLKDRLTGMKFSTTKETREQAQEWLEESKRILTEARPN